MSDSLRKALKQLDAAANNLHIESHDYALPAADRNKAGAAKAVIMALRNALENGAAYKTAAHAEHFDGVMTIYYT